MSINNELQLDRPMEDIRHEAVLNVVRTANVLSQKGASLFRKYDLTEAQFNVLFALKYKERDWTQSELSQRLVVTRASVTSVLDKLEEKALVQRTSVVGNRRIYHVDLTSGGRALMEEVEPVYRDLIHGLLEGYTDGACSKLIGYLESIRKQVQASE
jgi:MarR family transcriptional regulator, 2-MHQ and catechol-resistance regulon repressor